MPYYFFTWTPDLIDYLAEHEVTPEEFEEVVSNPERQEVSRSSGNLVAFGSTAEARYLCCVFKQIDADNQ